MSGHIEIQPNRLRKLRFRSRLTQRELGVLTGIDHTTISKHESGDRGLDQHDIMQYSRVFKVNTHEIFMDTEDRPWQEEPGVTALSNEEDDGA